MNLMFGTDPRGQGGIATVAALLIAEGFLSQQQSVYIISHASKLPQRGSALFIQALYRSTRLFLQAVLTLIYYCIRYKVHIVHVHSAMSGSFVRKSIILAIARAFGCRTIFHLHAGYFVEYATQDSSWLWRWWIKHTLRRSSKIITVSQTLATFLTRFAPGCCVTVIHNAVEPVPSNKDLEETYRILFLGDLIAAKGIFELLNAIALLKPQFPNIQLILGGLGNHEALQAKVNDLDIAAQVHFLGWLEAPQKLIELQRAAVFVLPSYFEGLPMAILEAMSAGKAVIATEIGGIPEVIKHQENGLLIAPKDAPALADALRQLFTQPELRTRLGKNAYQTMCEQYSITTLLHELTILYQELQ